MARLGTNAGKGILSMERRSNSERSSTTARNKLDFRREEVTTWRTGEAVVGTRAGILRAGTVRRVEAHRWWDLDGLEHVLGIPWQ